MKRSTAIGLLLLAGCAHTPDTYTHDTRMHDTQASERLMRQGSRAMMSSTQNSFLAASCYATAVNNRGDGFTANAARIDAEERYRVAVRHTRHPEDPIAIINVAPAGTGSTAELFFRPVAGSIEGFRRFLADRC
ncbi:MAG: hypothetical protein ACREVG_16980 [Burkholderiales bacterium]